MGVSLPDIKMYNNKVVIITVIWNQCRNTKQIIGANDKALKKGTYIVTLDEGVAVIGLYGELREAFESEDFSITSCTVRALIKGINTGLRIEKPEGIEK